MSRRRRTAVRRARNRASNLKRSEPLTSRLTEEVLFEREEGLPRAEVATYLRTVAGRLDAGETITFTHGDQSIDLEVPANPVFEVKVERETASEGRPSELSIGFELEWNEVSGQEGELSIE